MKTPLGDTEKKIAALALLPTMIALRDEKQKLPAATLA